MIQLPGTNDTINTLQKSLIPELGAIADKVVSGGSLSPAEGLLLFEKAEPGLLGVLADVVRTGTTATTHGLSEISMWNLPTFA